MKEIKLNKTFLVIGLLFMFAFSSLIFNSINSEVSAAEPILLRYAPTQCAPPPAKGMTQVISDQMKLIEERSNGRLKIDIYWGQTLAKADDLVLATSNGICDISKLTPHIEPGKIPLSSVGHQPGIGTHMFPRAQAYWDLMNQDILKSEYAKYGLRGITLNFITDTGILSTVPVRTIGDIKGKKLGSEGMVGQIVLLLGAVPIAMTPGDQYLGLQKGTIMAITAPYAAAYDFKFYEVAKYYTKFQFGFRIGPVVIREKTWEKLPSDIQKVITDSAQDLIKIAYEDFVETDELAKKAIIENGGEIIEPTEADKVAVNKILTDLADNWAEDLGKKGLPAKRLLADYRELVQKYEKTNPYK